MSFTDSSGPRTTPGTPPPDMEAPPEPPYQVEPPVEARESSSLFNSWSWKKNRSLSVRQVFGRDPLSSEQMCRLQQDKQMLTEEVKAQKVNSIRIEMCFKPVFYELTLSISM